ncbi:MAG: rRNA pseudouridine synthase [Rhodospirillaceae bacterium]|jgi:23S rRNA pseudouridine2605 synthase|nr:rRNA pseudouridine synthase [Rhodospirillaceae bacterium]MBT5894578.1 rRNA pseudouridine synthase [Rhodospirillaceae bacterium]MBT7755892.1 rRNA pseudouridine synthase [Rhodospirillaceae bacterium]
MNSKQDSVKPSDGERIAKRLARAGLCSRREAERWIVAGRVKVDGKVLETPACVVTAKSRIEVDGNALARAEPTKLWRHHKPKGLLTTNNDPEGRDTVFQHLPATLPRVVSVGRLDLNTEGLLLLTNDGALARHLELPSTGWRRRYRVRVHGNVDEKALARLADGVRIEGVSYGAIEAKLDSRQRGNAWLSLSLKEGKNREIRRVMEHMDLQVTRLIRLSYGPFQLGDLPRGEIAPVPRRILRDQLGAQAANFGLGDSDTGGDARKGKKK